MTVSSFLRRGARVQHLLSCLLFALVASCGDDPRLATFVMPVYEDACATYECSGQGACEQPAASEAPHCRCDTAYAGEHCERCDAGFHRDADMHCVPDRTCKDDGPNPCGIHGRCKDETGVVECSCNVGYEGARCNLCMPGYALDSAGDCLQKVLADGKSATLPVSCSAEACHDHGECSEVDRQLQCKCYIGYTGGRCEDCANDYERPHGIDRCVPTNLCNVDSCGGCAAFDGGKEFPNSPDTCVSTHELSLDGVLYSSSGGEGTLWLCAPSRRDGLTSEHIALEAGSRSPAEIVFNEAVDSVKFDYAAWDTDALDVLADDAVIKTLKGARYTKQSISLSFGKPITVLGFRSTDGYTRSFAIDNVVYESASGTCK